MRVSWTGAENRRRVGDRPPAAVVRRAARPPARALPYRLPDRPRGRRPLLLLAAALLLLGVVASPGLSWAEDAARLEYKVKGAFVFNFLKFIEWPDSRDSYFLCIAGTNPFGTTLEELNQHMSADRPIKLVFLPKPASAPPLQLQECDMLFVARDAQKDFGLIEERLAGAATVTVSEDLPAAGINLMLQEGKVRFSIRNEELKGLGIKVSSKMLRLALPEGAPEPGR